MSEKPLTGVYGTGGFGREVLPFARANMLADGLTAEHLVFIDDDPRSASCADHEVLTFEQFCKRPAARREAVLAVGDGILREKLALKCLRNGIELPPVVAPQALILDNVVMAEGAVLCPFAMITSDVVIGKYFQANIYAYVAHDCRIGDRVTLAPGAKVNGNVIIESGAYIGTGAIIKQGIPGAPLLIGENAVVGMGAVVTKDVPAGATVVGNPARPLN